jgi:hypothetical protein
MIAIWSARRAGFDTGAEVWRAANDYFREHQNEDGGWGYSDKQRRNSCGSMTGAGIAAATIARAGLMGERWRTHDYAADPVVRRGLGWLGTKFAVDKNPDVDQGIGRRMRERKTGLIGEDFWRLYYLWSVERAAGLLDRDRIGEHRWYQAGAEQLLSEQTDEGHWVTGSSPDRGTAFALLFLSRGTRPVATEPALSNETVTPR